MSRTIINRGMGISLRLCISNLAFLFKFGNMNRFESQLRLGTGIVLALYVAQHLLNHSAGIISIEAAEAYRETIGAAFQTLPGLLLLYGSILFHVGIALHSVYRRSSLRLPRWQTLQLLLGLSIPPLLVGHVIANRGFALLGDVDPNYYYVVTSLALKPEFLVKLILLIVVIWIHLVIGLHFWLRTRPGYSAWLPYTYALALLIPVLALIGIYRMLREASAWLESSTRVNAARLFPSWASLCDGEPSFAFGFAQGSGQLDLACSRREHALHVVASLPTPLLFDWLVSLSD